jgi:tetratricopeptide (TPR) repeat protein
MRSLTGARITFILLAIVVVGSPTRAQDNPDAYKAERQKAVELFNQKKFLDALPMFEDLVKQNPADSETLLGLATCLVNHSATIQDKDAAAKERLRARDLLLKAKELGNNSDLLQNLLQLLQASNTGQMKYSENPEADKEFRTAEAAFAKRDFQEAIAHYSKALELDPANYSASLFIGDSYFAAQDFAKAADWYERTSQMDPNRETAFRYYADMLAKNGDMEKARTEAIRAVVAEPYNAIPWRGLQQWATANKLQINRVFIKVPNSISQKDDKNVTISIDPNQKGGAATAWMIYSISQAAWHTAEFNKTFPDEKQYRHSLPEETQALTMAAESLIGNDKKKPLKTAGDPDLALLLRIYQAGMIEPYVLLNAADAGIAKDYDAYRQKNRAKLEEYLSTFVVPAGAAQK